MQREHHLASGDLCRESAPLGQLSRVSACRLASRRDGAPDSMVVHPGMNSAEFLQRLRTSKALHRLFASPIRLMRILCAIVEPTADPCAARLQHRSRSSPLNMSEAHGDDVPRPTVFLHDPLEKLQRRGFVPLRGSHLFQDLALMIDSAPQIAEPAVDLHEHIHPSDATADSRAYARRVAYESRRRTSDQTGSTRTGRVLGLMSIPRSANRSSTLRSDSGYRAYIITTRRTTSGELLKYRNRSLIRRG
jgi:hypothetical protein